jgi:UDP-glucose 4-epimerase
VVADLAEHGHTVTGIDLVVPPPGVPAPAAFLRADLTDYGQAVEVLTGADAVVHLANIPAPGLRTPSVTFNQNMTMNFNVFQAAAGLGLGRVVWASSETVLGLPFDPEREALADVGMLTGGFSKRIIIIAWMFCGLLAYALQLFYRCRIGALARQIIANGLDRSERRSVHVLCRWHDERGR